MAGMKHLYFPYLCPLKNAIYCMTPYNSKYIEQKLGEIKDRKNKNSFLESIMNDPTAALLYEVNGHKTVSFPENKGVY